MSWLVVCTIDSSLNNFYCHIIFIANVYLIKIMVFIIDYFLPLTLAHWALALGLYDYIFGSINGSFYDFVFILYIYRLLITYCNESSIVSSIVLIKWLVSN